jgi:hypothetical protein
MGRNRLRPVAYCQQTAAKRGLNSPLGLAAQPAGARRPTASGAQQIRNYEVGYTRVNVVIVVRLAHLYQRPVGWFLEEVPLGDEAKAVPAAGLIERERIVAKVHNERPRIGQKMI